MIAILKATVRAIDADNCLGLAAQLAFYFLLALFPALLFLVALVGYLPIQDAMTELLAALATVAPREFWTWCAARSTTSRGATGRACSRSGSPAPSGAARRPWPPSSTR